MSLLSSVEIQDGPTKNMADFDIYQIGSNKVIFCIVLTKNELYTGSFLVENR